MQEAIQEAMQRTILEVTQEANLEVVNCKEKIFFMNIFFICAIIFL